MKYYIIAGEASGDLHASNLIKELKVLDESASFRCWGGDLMQQEGATIVKHYKDLAFMGFVEVITNIRTILKNIYFCQKDIASYAPDAVVLIDYPGFNLKIAKWAKKKKFNVFYYISPQIWAWKQSRIHTIKKYVDKMFVILPFEKEYYKKFNYEVDFVGHPLLDAINRAPDDDDDKFLEENNLSDKPIIAVLPGSRKQEISKILPIMLEITPKFTDYQFVIAGAPSIPDTFYTKYLKKGVYLVKNQTHGLLRNAYAGIITSGTATLEAALFNTPQVVCYKGNILSFYIATLLIKVKFISLVNLIADKKIVEELIQNNLTARNLVQELQKITTGDERNTVLTNYKGIYDTLKKKGASKRTAELMFNYLAHTSS